MNKKLFWIGSKGIEQKYSVGDNAQLLGIQKMIDKYFSDYTLIKISIADVLTILDMKVEKTDLIFIQSGGGWGDLYPAWTSRVKKIIDTYQENRLIQLPVSICYKSIVSFENDKVFFSNKPNLTILCRTENETKLLKENYNCDVQFFPDFAYYLDPTRIETERKGTLVAARSDCGSLSMNHYVVTGKLRKLLIIIRKFTGKNLTLIIEEYKYKRNTEALKEMFAKKYPGALIKDLQVSDIPITDENRTKIVFDTINRYAQFKKVVTDRYHAMVFCALTNTPVKGLPNLMPYKTHISNKVHSHTYFENFRKNFVDEFKAIKEKEVEVTKNSNVFEIIKNRRSIRSWNKKEVSTCDINKIVEMGYWSPTASNTQAITLRVVTDKKLIDKFLEISWFKQNPPDKIIVVIYDLEKPRRVNLDLNEWNTRFLWQDSAVAMITMIYAAEALGLKTCWATCSEGEAAVVSKCLNLKKTEFVPCMLLIGYSNQKVSLNSMHQGRIIRRYRLEEKTT